MAPTEPDILDAPPVADAGVSIREALWIASLRAIRGNGWATTAGVVRVVAEAGLDVSLRDARRALGRLSRFVEVRHRRGQLVWRPREDPGAGGQASPAAPRPTETLTGVTR